MTPPPVGGGAAVRRGGFVYLLKSRFDGTFYIGWTTDPLRRLAEHNQGFSSYGRRKRPWHLVGFERFSSSEEAKTHERALKRNPRMLQLFKKRMLSRAAEGRSRQVVG